MVSGYLAFFLQKLLCIFSLGLLVLYLLICWNAFYILDTNSSLMKYDAFAFLACALSFFHFKKKMCAFYVLWNLFVIGGYNNILIDFLLKFYILDFSTCGIWCEERISVYPPLYMDNQLSQHHFWMLMSFLYLFTGLPHSSGCGLISELSSVYCFIICLCAILLCICIISWYLIRQLPPIVCVSNMSPLGIVFVWGAFFFPHNYYLTIYKLLSQKFFSFNP